VYGPVELAKAFAEEKEEVITEMGKRLEANPTEAGVDEARKVFEAKKDSLRAKRNAIKTSPQGFNVDWQTVLSETEHRHEQMMDAIGIKLSIACHSDQCDEKWKALAKDFKETVDRY
jgi:tRNA A37 threonylcarbamoyladenosine dehydratase